MEPQKFFINFSLLFCWQPCSDVTSSLQLMVQLLPGTTIMAQSNIPYDIQAKVAALKRWPAVHWGTLETVVSTQDHESVFSYVLWAKGRMYDKLIVIVNFGSRETTDDYVKKLDKFTVPAKGRVLLSYRGNVKRVGDIVEMGSLTVSGGEMLVIQFPPLGI